MGSNFLVAVYGMSIDGALMIGMDTTENEETYWDQVARTQWGSYITDIEADMIMRASQLATGLMVKSALDVGCGSGRWSLLLASQGWEMVCTDIYPQELSICQRKIPTAKCILVERDATSLPCDTDSIGLLLCVEVFDVLHSDWFLPEAARVLCSSGILVGVIGNKTSIRGWLHSLGRMLRKLDPYYYYKISYPQWRKKLIRSGFEVIEEKGLCWGPFQRDSDSFFVPVFTNIEKSLGLRELPSISPWIALLARKRDTALLKKRD